MSDSIRLMIDPPGRGGWNMAVDEWLLKQANAGTSALRVYTWSEPTLSLGYFQSYADRESHEPSRQCEIVRRRSGGGAIMHDRELTYSLALPLTQRWGRDAEALYQRIHGAAIRWLAQFGCQGETHEGPVQEEAFLCFQRRAVGDIVCGGNKIMGSAQRRSKSGVLQHGSLLLQRSEFAPELPGLVNLAKDAPAWNPSDDQHARSFAMALIGELALEGHEDSLSKNESDLVTQIATTRFDDDQWTRRR